MVKSIKSRSTTGVVLAHLGLLLMLSCTGQDVGETDTSQRKQTTNQNSQACSEGACSDTAAADPFGNQNSAQSSVPNFDNANLDSRFNRSKLAKQAIPEEFKTIPLIGKRSTHYRAVWLDLRKEAWAGFEGFSKRLGNDVLKTVGDKEVADYLAEAFEAAKTPEISQDVSVYQPLQNYSILPFDDEPMQFYLAGHLANPDRGHPKDGTLVLTPSPYIESNDTAIAPPLDYELVYEKDGLYTDDTLNKCGQMYADLGAGKLFVPPIQLQTQCDTILPGTLMGSYNQTTGNYNNAFDELFKKQSVAIWKPLPQEGYKCLGFVATNGKKEKPFTERDFAQSVVDIGVSDRYAMYCVKDEFVAKGKLQLPPIGTDGEITLFTITNDLPDGYGDGNMFYAFKGHPTAEELSKVEVWVPRLDSIKIIEDDK